MAEPGGRPLKAPARVLVNAIPAGRDRLLLLPHDFRIWQIVNYYFRRWQRESGYSPTASTRSAPGVAIAATRAMHFRERTFVDCGNVGRLVRRAREKS